MMSTSWRVAGLAALVFALGCGTPSGDATGQAPPGADGVTTAADTLDLPATNLYEITTPYGALTVRLYDETPIHRDNFKKLVDEAFYDSTTFHRVIETFMIQGGDPNSKDDDPFNDGEGDPGYTLPAELVPGLIHKRGALAAARQGDRVNPERRSSGSQFYIVQGATFEAGQLDHIEQQTRAALRDTTFRFSEEARARYATEGGAPFLDGQYTVFGEVVEGFDVLDRIAQADTPRRMGTPAMPALADRPPEPIWMTIRPVTDDVP